MPVESQANWRPGRKTGHGKAIDVVIPGRDDRARERHRLRYTSTDGQTKFDITQTALTPLLVRGHIMPGEEDHHDDPGRVPGGSEQFMHCTGQLELHGEHYDIDCHAPRDRSWRQVRKETQGGVPVPRWGAYRPEGSMGTLTFPGCEVSDVHLDADRAKFELTLRINEDDAETYVCAEFDACLYTDEYINDLLDDYLAVLAGFLPSAHEDAVAAVFADVLGVPVDRDSDFFALGGDSGQLLWVLLRLRAEFGGRVDLRSLYRDPVVRRVARRLLHHDPHS